MKKKILNFMLILILIFTLSSCGEIQQTPDTPPSIDIPGSNEGNKDNPVEGNPDLGSEVEYSVSLIYNKKVYIPSSGEEIKVIWADQYSRYSQVIGEDGYAKMKLDGEFNVYLDGCPSGYTYNPNIYKVDNESPIIEIELLKIAKVRGGGTLSDEISISTTGTYRATIKSNSKKVFYSFAPKKPGYYSIESIVNVYEDNVNPKVDSYNGNAGGTRYYDKTYNTGGKSLKGGYTKNFEYKVRLSDDQTAGVFFIFGIYAESKTGVYPVDVDFTITYLEDYVPEYAVAKVMVAEEAGFKTDEFSSSKYIYKNSDHGNGSYYNGVTNGTGFLDADDYAYNEETGFWHVYYKDTQTFGPKLCAKITEPCAYYEESLNNIESHGNKNLTVSNGTENYKQFIEGDYAAACNSDGVCYVTNELKEFLQKFSVSQRLFFDGNGFVESTGVYAIEEDQWLFACGYYEEK